MFAIVQIGSSQYVVREKDELLVDRLPEEEGKSFLLDKVLLFSDEDSKKVLVGTPFLTHVSVEVRVMGEEKGEKIVVFKMKAKKRYRRTRGHRSLHTRIKILKISTLSGEEAPKKVPVKRAPKKVEASAE